MNCWEILGIEPTGDRRKIQDAYEQQLKFASEDEARSLEQAFREAVGDSPAPATREAEPVQSGQPSQLQDEEPERPWTPTKARWSVKWLFRSRHC